MIYTVLPSIKGQITIPNSIRKKYKISKKTPMIIEDTGDGIITMKVMVLTPHTSATQYYENVKETGLTFPNGIDPDLLINTIKKIDG